MGKYDVSYHLLCRYLPVALDIPEPECAVNWSPQDIHVTGKYAMGRIPDRRRDRLCETKIRILQERERELVVLTN